MLKVRCFLVAFVVVALAHCPPVPAQAPEKATPPPEDVLRRVPAGCLGFAVIRNAGEFAAEADKFAASIAPPGQPPPQEGLMQQIRSAIGLEEGLDERGGFAVVMLDPRKHGPDLAKIIAAMEKDDEPEVTFDKVPLVFLIPGRDPAKMFASRNPTTEGGVVKITGEPGDPPQFCVQHGGYVALSAHRKALAALTAGQTKSVLTQLSPRDTALLAANGAAVWVNMQMLGAILDAAVKPPPAEGANPAKKDPPPKPGGAPAPGPKRVAEVLGEQLAVSVPIIKQMRSAAAGLRFDKTGVVVEGQGQLLPDSAIAKALLAGKAAPGALLGRLPDLPYAVAFGGRRTAVVPKDLLNQQIDALLARGPAAGLSAELKAKCRQLVLDWQEQVLGVEMVAAAGGPEGGALRIAFVVDCVSSGRFRKLLARTVDVVTEVVKTTPEQGVPKVSVKYLSEAETVAQQKVDVLAIEKADLDEKDRQALKGLFGDEKLAVRIADAADGTVVMTLGGGGKFLGEARRAAAAGAGKLEKAPPVAEVLGKLPKARVALALVNVKNILLMGEAVAKASGEKPLPAVATSDLPIAGAVAVEGSCVRFSGYVPGAAVRDTFMAIMAAMMQAMQEAMQEGQEMPPPPP